MTIGSRRAANRGLFDYGEWLADHLDAISKPAIEIWDFDGDGPPNVLGNHPGSFVGAPPRGQDPLVDDSGGSVDLSTSGDYFSVPNNAALFPGTGSMTYLAWWEWDGTEDSQQNVISATGGENWQHFASSGRIFARAWDDSTISSLGDAQKQMRAPAPRGIMSAMVLDGSSETLTVAANTRTLTLSQIDFGDVSPGFDMGIGEADGGGNTVGGRIDLVAAIPHVLTDAERARIYAVGRKRHRTLDIRHQIWSDRQAQTPTLDDVFLLAGQSNCIGLSNSRQYDTDFLHSARGFYHDKREWHPLDNHDSPRIFENSAWPTVAELHGLHTSRSIGFIQTSEGSTAVSEWLPSASSGYYDRMISTFNDASQTDRTVAAIWYQGEKDIQQGTSQSAYASDLNTIVDAIKSDTGLDTVVGKTHNWPNADDANHRTITDAQQQVIDNNPNALAGTDQSNLNLPQLHYETDDEIQTFGRDWWEALERLFYGGVT